MIYRDFDPPEFHLGNAHINDDDFSMPTDCEFGHAFDATDVGPYKPKRSSLDIAIKLSGQFGFSDIRCELEALKARQGESGRTLAFVGEFSRGKSHLINRLLDRNLLPTGVLPTTPVLTSLVYAAKECIEVVRPGGEKQLRPLVDASWTDLRAFDEGGSSTEVSATVQVRVDSEWLKSLDAEIIDTPGLGDLFAPRTAAVEDFIYRCDAVVIVVSAKVPFGITEATFLKDYLLARHVSAILVVVSMLDLVPQAERSAVMNEIGKKIGKISKDVQVLPSHELCSEAEQTTLNRMKASIHALVRPTRWRKRRWQRIAGLLSDHLSVLAQLGRSGLKQVALDQAVQATRAESARGRLEAMEQEWKHLLIEFDRRCLNASEEFGARLMSKRDELSEILCFEVMKSSDPKAWWERDFPFRLRGELAALGRRSEEFMLKAIATDSQWLREQAQKAFGVEVQSPEPSDHKRDAVSVDAVVESQLTLANLKSFREFSLAGGGAAAVLGYLLQGPAALAIGLGGGAAWMGRRMFEGKANEQRLEVADNIAPALEISLESYRSHTASRLRRLYAAHAENVKRTFQGWLSAQSYALGNTEGHNAVDWQRLVDSAETLKTEVAQDLEGDAGWSS